MNEQNIDLVIFGGLGDLAGRKLLPVSRLRPKGFWITSKKDCGKICPMMIGLQ